jgi:enoyl-CoA hydratase
MHRHPDPAVRGEANMSGDEVLITTNGPVTTIALNREFRRNAVDRKTGDLLRSAFAAFEADDDQRVAVLTGSDDVFCAGFDLTSLSSDGIAYAPEGDGPMGPTRMLLSKPTIAAVEGYAVAGGLELALWCDLRVASASAVFGVFCRRWGVPLVDGGTVRLPRLIGHSRALDMILTGRPVDAQEALSFGLANRVVPRGKALEEAQRLALEIARFPQICMRTDRMSSYRQWGADVESALRFEGIEGERPLLEEARAGVARFAGGAGRGGAPA